MNIRGWYSHGHLSHVDNVKLFTILKIEVEQLEHGWSWTNRLTKKQFIKVQLETHHIFFNMVSIRRRNVGRNKEKEEQKKTPHRLRHDELVVCLGRKENFYKEKYFWNLVADFLGRSPCFSEEVERFSPTQGGLTE